MYNAVIEFLRKFGDSTTATSMFPALAGKQAALVSRVANLETQLAIQGQPLDGELEAREGALDAARESAVIAAGAVLSYARTNELPALAAQVRRVRTEMRELRCGERMRIAQRVHDVAAPLVTQLADYGFTAAMLEELQANIDGATEAVNTPVSTRAAKKVSTRDLARGFRAVEQVLAEIDPMLLRLGKIDPTSHGLYLAARAVVRRSGTRASTSETQGAAPSNTTTVEPPAERQAA